MFRLIYMSVAVWYIFPYLWKGELPSKTYSCLWFQFLTRLIFSNQFYCTGKNDISDSLIYETYYLFTIYYNNYRTKKSKL